MNNVQYCFVSHGEKILEDCFSIPLMMRSLGYDNYVIVYGGQKKSINNDKVIHLECNDLYCGLPEKTNSMFKYVTNNFDYDFYIKLDRTVIVNKFLNDEHKINYGGFIHNFDPSNPNWQRYHFGRCESTSPWYEKEFNGTALKFCSGIVYILSKDNAKIIAKDNFTYTNHIYEDYYVGSLLKENGIDAKYLPIKEYYFDPDHKWMFR